MLLLAVAAKPMYPRRQLATAPLLITKRLNGPLVPTQRSQPMSQRVFVPVSETVLDLAVELRPMKPLSVLVSSAPLVSVSRVKEPLVPMITLPVIELVTLLSVADAPSATSWPCATGTMVKANKSRRILAVRPTDMALRVFINIQIRCYSGFPRLPETFRARCLREFEFFRG